MNADFKLKKKNYKKNRSVFGMRKLALINLTTVSVIESEFI